MTKIANASAKGGSASGGKKYIVANWKNHPDSVAEAEDILVYIDEYLKNETDKKERSLIICPPFVFLDDVNKILNTSRLAQQVELGAQDIALSDSGAWTGEVSGPMLKRLGVKYVIVGHSDRRWKISESDEIVNKKLKTILANEITPIVCVGERERNAEFKNFLKNQIEATFAGLSAGEIGKCLIAYEPVWAISRPAADIARSRVDVEHGVEPQRQTRSRDDQRSAEDNIGTGTPDTPESVLESIAIIQDVLNSKFVIRNSKFLYGGSVTASNVKDFLSLNQIAGVIVGGASIQKEEFIQILKNL